MDPHRLRVGGMDSITRPLYMVDWGVPRGVRNDQNLGSGGGVQGGSRWGSLINSLIGENGRGGPEGSTLNPGRILGRILSPRDVFSPPEPPNWFVKMTPKKHDVHKVT